MDFPELRMTRVHLSSSENIEDINSGREGHGMEQSRGCRSKDEWAGHQLGLVHLSCPSPLPPCAPLYHHRSPALPKLYWRSWGNWKDINAAPLCNVYMCAYYCGCACMYTCVYLCVFVVAPFADWHDGYQAAPGREEVALACVPTSTKLSNLVRFEVFSLYFKFNRFDIFTCIQTISLDLYLEIKDWGSGCNKTPNKPK